jgi:hypothetical protein
MAVLTKTQYNGQGELLAPQRLRTSMMELRNRIQGPASFERGYIHYFEFRADDQHQLLRKLSRFIAMLDAAKGEIVFYEDGPAPHVPGYTPRLIARITYVVE